METIACLILNYKDYEETISCVNNLLKIDTERYLEIVIVDNNSPNGSFELLTHEFKEIDNVSVIESGENGGYAKGNNFGFRFIEKNYPSIKKVLLMNPDTRILSFDSIKAMSCALDENEKVAIIAPVVIFNGKVNYQMTAWDAPNLRHILRLQCRFIKSWQRQYIDEGSHGIVYVDAVQGGLFMSKMTAMCEVDFFDERTFLYSEEIILAKKMENAGYCEAVLTDHYFTHTHKDQKSMMSLSSRLWDERNSFNSRKIYCESFLNKKAVRCLKVVSAINIVYIYLTQPLKLLLRALKLI